MPIGVEVTTRVEPEPAIVLVHELACERVQGDAPPAREIEVRPINLVHGFRERVVEERRRVEPELRTGGPRQRMHFVNQSGLFIQ